MRSVIAVAVLLLGLVASALAADVTGKWKASVQGPDGQNMEITFDLKADGGVVTGTSTTSMGSMDISDGKLDGDKISFTVANDQFKVVHQGTVSGDEMKLKVEMGDNTFDITAQRAK
jgi:opacity protein-like surface antigen